MTKHLTSYRRDWKAIVLGYDDIIVSPSDVSECEYCLTVPQVEALLAIVEPMAWPTRWFSETDETIDKDAIEAFRDDIRKRLMMSCCGNDRMLRVTQEGVVQASYDGGDTWVDSPQDDPRSFVPIAAPIPGDDGDEKRCAAANSATAYLKQEQLAVLAAKENNAKLSDIAAIIIGFLLLLGIIASGGLFAVLGATLAVLATNIDATAFAAAFTADTWQALACIIYNRSDSAGNISRDNWVLVKADIAGQIGGTAGNWLVAAVNQIGFIGLQNAEHLGLANDPEIDCGSCSSCVIVDNWHLGAVWDGSGYITGRGNVIETGNCYAIIESQDRGDGVQAVYAVSDGDSIHCANATLTEVVSGSITSGQTVKIACGTSRVYTNYASDIGWSNVNALGQLSTTAFTVRIDFGSA